MRQIIYWVPRVSVVDVLGLCPCSSYASTQPYDMLIHPWMLLLTAIHEAAHAFVVVVTGGHVVAIEIDLPGSGATYWYPRNFNQKTRAEYLVAPAGYLTGGFVGAALVFAGFSILASKIAVFVLAGILLFALIFVVKDRVALPTILLALLIPIPLFLIEHARFLRYYILWSGTVVSVYNIVLCLHTLVFRIIPGSDAHVFSRLAGGSPRVRCSAQDVCNQHADLTAFMVLQLWGLLWTTISFVFFALAVLGGILAVRCATCSRCPVCTRLMPLRASPLQFHQNLRQQIRQGQRFLPT